MQFQNLPENLFGLFSGLKSGGFLIEAVLVCLLVQLTKNTLINKLKIDLTKKFDPTILLPFAYGLIFAVLEAVFITRTFDGVQTLYLVAINGISIGATSVVIYRTFSAFDKTNIKTLCKDGVFEVLYNEIMIVSDIKQKLLDKEITLKEFVAKLTSAVAGIKAVYGEDIDANLTSKNASKSIDTADKSQNGDIATEQIPQERTNEQKQECLKTLLSGFVGESNLAKTAETLHKAFVVLFKKG